MTSYLADVYTSPYETPEVAINPVVLKLKQFAFIAVFGPVLLAIKTRDYILGQETEFFY